MSELLARQIRARIDPEAIARDVLEFVDVRSETGAEGQGSLFLAELLRREGFLEVELEEIGEGRPNVYVHVPGAGGGPTLLLNGHTDTIPVGQCPGPARDGDWLLGRGTEDMKGGLAAMVHGAAALRNAGVELAGDLWLTGVVGHETPVGRKEGPRRLIEHLRSGRIPAGAVLIVEGPCAVWAASLGSAMFTIRGRADREPVHTLKVPYAENPARWLGELLVELARFEAEFEAGEHHPLCGRQQLNVGMVRAGDWFNRLPVTFEVTGTRRWLPGMSRDDVVDHFRQACDRIAGRSGLSFEIELSNDREPFATPADHPLVQSVSWAAEMAAGSAPQIIGMALVGDANLYANEGGVAPVYYGPGYDTAHSDGERVSLARLAHCAEVYALTAARYCGVA
ncbi:MAG: M20/M25/M40 family metallo-hydrolase [Gemmatimonadota bacterium]